MGLFDSVYFTCPNCKASLEAQSKAGDCCMDTIDPYEVPVGIAKDIENKVLNCGECGRSYRVVSYDQIPKTVSMGLQE